MAKFCAEGAITNPTCYKLETFDFVSEESIFDILLDVLKSELPTRLSKIKDCQGKPMLIDEDHIGITPPQSTAKFQVILNPLGDVPDYSENRSFRTVEYNFELMLSVGSTVLDCVTWELVRFKNVVEGLLIGSELVIDGYDGVYIEPRGFQYRPFGSEGSGYYRNGSYRFSVTVTQYKIN